MSSRHLHFIGALALLLAVTPPCRAEGPYHSGTASVTWEDNATEAPGGDGVRWAFTVASGGAATWIDSEGFSTLPVSSLSANVGACTTFRGLGEIALGPRHYRVRDLGAAPVRGRVEPVEGKE